jgi:hypothetical protein
MPITCISCRRRQCGHWANNFETHNVRGHIDGHAVRDVGNKSYKRGAGVEQSGFNNDAHDMLQCSRWSRTASLGPVNDILGASVDPPHAGNDESWPTVSKDFKRSVGPAPVVMILITIVKAQNAAPKGFICFTLRRACWLSVISRYSTTPVTAVFPRTSRPGRLITSHERP